MLFFLLASLVFNYLIVSFSEAAEGIVVIKSANYRMVRAELSYQEIEDGMVSKPKIKISHAGKVIFSEPIKINEQDTFMRLSSPMTVDLDGDWEPEIVIEVSRSNNKKVEQTLIYSYKQETASYKKFKKDWPENIQVVSIKDIDEDGSPEFLAYDARFQSKSSNNPEEAYRCPTILRFHNDELQLMNEKYRDFIESGAQKDLLRSELLIKQKPKDKSEVKVLLASYVILKTSLGEEDEAWKKVKSIYREKDSKQFFHNLSKFISETGHKQPDKN
jgi:hypothetical protein